MTSPATGVAVHTEAALLTELHPVVEALLARHLTTRKPWYPHEFVPYSLGRDFGPDYVWDETEVVLPAALRSALFVNLLTEDNLPYYFQSIDRMFAADGAWGEWARLWTAEEARHSIAIRDFLTVTRTLDPRVVEDGRMAQMSLGQVPDPERAIDGLVYVALQELATRIAHRNTGRAVELSLPGDPIGMSAYAMLSRVASDENFHFLFYRDLVSAALEIAPSIVLPAIERQVRGFVMPGTGIVGFKEHAEAIAQAGLYNLEQHHSQILEPVVLKTWKIEALTNLDDAAEAARDATLARISRIGSVAARLARRQAPVPA